MLLLARLAVLAAALCGLWFNGSYAWTKADALPHQLGLLAFALTVDLCKVSFLPAAAYLWFRRHRARAIVLVLLWLPAIVFSTFCGYAALHGNRSNTAAMTDANAQQRARLQAAYSRADTDLATARSSPLWTQSAGCTAIKANHRDFCANVTALQNTQRRASDQLGSRPILTPDVELATLHITTGLSHSTLSLIASLFPAVLIELAASLGAYAVSPPCPAKPSQTASVQRFAWWRRRTSIRNAAAATPRAGSPSSREIPAATPSLTWPAIKQRPP